VDLNGISLRIRNDKDPEKIIIKKALLDLRKLVADQGMFVSSHVSQFIDRWMANSQVHSWIS
jgi:hypothetical protein